MSISYYKNQLITNLADSTKINYKAYYNNYILFGADADTGDTPTDYSEQYLTFVAKSSGTFNFLGSTTTNTISYSTDRGNTWSTLAQNVTVNVNSGDTVLWKGNMTPNTDKGIGSFSGGTAQFDAQGNTMSLLFGDNYKNQTSLSGKNYAFKYLFKGSKVVNAENFILPATTLSIRCYTWMFSGCTSLVTAPELPATTMAECSYGNMFEGCSSLTTAPELPATNLSSEAYSSLFQNCTSLVNPPELPATTLQNYCYKFMFRGCTSLRTAPTLSATSLNTTECYAYMFSGCTNLNYIEMLATNISAYGCLTDWVNGVAASGTFVKHPSMTSLPSGKNGIPNGWIVQNQLLDYLAFVAKSSGTFNFSGTTTTNTISYSTDRGNTWSTLAQNVTVNVNSGDTVLWKGNMTPTNNGIGRFSGGTASFDMEGNIMSLLYGDNFFVETSLANKNYVFTNLMQSTKVINAENLKLPATILSDYCYRDMFNNCTSLATAPQLPSTSLANYCYQRMFQGCSNLTTAPQLPATTMASYCYANMFNSCRALVTTPQLLATTLADYCCGGMFAYCSSLTTAPELLATTLAIYCYESMFYGCSKINHIKMLATNISASGCLFNWVSGVASSGTFVKHPSMTSLQRGSNGIPSNWTVQDASS